MAVVSVENIVFEFIPAFIVTLAYQLFFRKRRNRFIEAFIIMIYLKTATTFIYSIVLFPQDVPASFDSTTSNDVFAWVFIEDFLFIASTALQEYLLWIMISFFAVLFGLLVLMVKLTLQDPAKRTFSNVIRSVVGSEPETDGYSGLRHRLENITFEGVEEQPLDPQVTRRVYGESWKDYLIIGLATLLPSMPLYAAFDVDHLYAFNIAIFLAWVYRFGYTSSNRIAKGAGVTLGNRDVGGEMMRGVLGWFFRLNILLSLFFIFVPIPDGPPTILDFFGIGLSNIDTAISYFSYGFTLTLPPILFAILIFPLTEDFAIYLYK